MPVAKKSLLFALQLLPCSAALAAVVSLDDPRFGPGAITLDTDTRLEWLDVSVTEGMSLDAVVAQLGIGGAFEGFSVARTSDFRTLIGHAGWVFAENTAYVDDRAKYEVALGLARLLGLTHSSNEPQNLSYGFVADTDPSGRPYYDAIYSAHSAVYPFSSGVFTNQFSHPAHTGLDHVGVWLHRAQAAPHPIDEPGVPALLGAAVLMMALQRGAPVRRSSR